MTTTTKKKKKTGITRPRPVGGVISVAIVANDQTAELLLQLIVHKGL